MFIIKMRIKNIIFRIEQLVTRRPWIALLPLLVLLVTPPLLIFALSRNNSSIYLPNRGKATIRKIKQASIDDSAGLGGLYIPEPMSTPLSTFTYVVQEGDSIHSIARKLRIDEVTIIKLNNIDIPSRIYRGMELVIPNQDGIVVSVTEKNSLDVISRDYGIDKADLLRTNNIEEEVAINSIFVPGIHFDSVSKQLILGEYFRRPAWGRITSYYGFRKDPWTKRRGFHNGLDIANRKNSYIYAAAPGKVIYAGWTWPLGNTVKIRHTSGYVTVYGHCNKILVKKNAWVAAGRVIALMGSTGRSTGNHLHYEVRRYGRTVNPISMTVF
jgi:murein DD-endopeptidase MepM/ murein hydrolase activator NlpD